jgi:hypothetical protein
MSIIRIFCIPREGTLDIHAVAIDEENKFITAQICSSETWAWKDMYSPFHKWFYNNRYPDGYDIIFHGMEIPPESWDGQLEHTDESVKPWHLDPANGSTLYQNKEK